MQKKLEEILDHSVIIASPDEDQIINSLGIITGGANNEWTFALEEGVDAYLTGEISEYIWHDSQEAGIHMFAGGHNATESFGIQSLKKHLESKFEFESIFIESPNPA